MVSRVETLESLLGAERSLPPTAERSSYESSLGIDSQEQDQDHIPTSNSTPRDLDMNEVVVNHSALRTVGLMTQQPRTPPSQDFGPDSRPPLAPTEPKRTDPVKLGILSMGDAQKLVDLCVFLLLLERSAGRARHGIES